MSETLDDLTIEEIAKDQAYFDAAVRYAEEQGYRDFADAVHGLKARLSLLNVTNDVLKERIKELEQAQAEKKRRETTFTDFLQRYIDYWQHQPGGHADTREQTGKFIYEQWCELNAIEGGALDVDGEK